jgi:hypothetical protein
MEKPSKITRIAVFFLVTSANILLAQFAALTFSTAPGIITFYFAVAFMIVFTLWFGVWGAVAVFCLPNNNGNIDYTGFTGTDPKFLEWCKDLFFYYWEKAKPFSSK